MKLKANTIDNLNNKPTKLGSTSETKLRIEARIPVRQAKLK